MKNLIFNLIKLFFHCIAVYVAFFGMIEAVNGLAPQWIIKAYGIALGVLCFTILASVEYLLATQLREFIVMLKLRFQKHKSEAQKHQLKALPQALIGTLLCGGIGLWLCVDGSTQTPYYKRKSKVAKQDLKNVDSLRIKFTATVSRIEESNQQGKAELKAEFDPTITILQSQIQKAPAYNVPNLSSKLEGIKLLYAKEKASLSKNYKEKLEATKKLYGRLITEYQQHNQLLTTKAKNKDRKTGSKMLVFTLFINMFIILLTIISKPIDVTRSVFTKLNFVGTTVNNTVVSITNNLQAVNQQITLDFILCDADVKTKEYFEKGKDPKAKKKIAEMLMPVLMRGGSPTEVVSKLNEMKENSDIEMDYSRGMVYHIKKKIEPLLLAKRLIKS